MAKPEYKRKTEGFAEFKRYKLGLWISASVVGDELNDRHKYLGFSPFRRARKETSDRTMLDLTSSGKNRDGVSSSILLSFSSRP